MSTKVKKKVISYYEYLVSVPSGVSAYIAVSTTHVSIVAEKQGQPWRRPVHQSPRGFPS